MQNYKPNKFNTMQFKVTLQCIDRQRLLPISYQYELSAWIYKVLHNADAAYSEFLHQQGYQTPQRKSFKLFSFSQLDAPRYEVQGDRLLIQSDTASFYISFYLDKTAEEFIRGLFSQQQFKLGDRISRVAFMVKTIEMCQLFMPVNQSPVHIRLRSPLVIARKRPDNKTDEYLHPSDSDFEMLFFLNLVEKYRAATRQAPLERWNNHQFEYRTIGRPPKSRLVTIKAGTKEETKVRGWLFDFELNVPHELLEIGLLAGFGRMNAEGFGWGEVLRESNNQRAQNQS